MMMMVLAHVLATAGCATLPHTRLPPVVMAARYSRREVVKSPDTFYKSFTKAGGGEALLGVIAGGLALYGGTRREALYAEIAALDASAPKASVQHLPLVTLASASTPGKIKLEITAPDATAGEVDSMWLKDAGSNEIISARQFRSGAAPELSLLLDRGQRLIPVVHCSDGVTVGAAFDVK